MIPLTDRKKVRGQALKINKPYLKYIISDRGDTMGGLADAMGIIRGTLTSKFAESVNITLGEVQFIVERYKMTDDEILKAFFRG